MADCISSLDGLAGPRIGKRARLCLSTALVLGAWAIPVSAQAACSETAPGNGETVTCDGSTTTGVINNSAADVTVNIADGASVVPLTGQTVWLGTGAHLDVGVGSTIGNDTINFYAVQLGSGATVQVDGTITGRGGIAGATTDFPDGLTNSIVMVSATGQILAAGTAGNSAILGRGGGNTYHINGLVKATGTSGQGITPGNGDHINLGATGSIVTLSGDTSTAVNGSSATGVTVVTAAGSLIELHGIGRGIQLGANADVTVGGTIRSHGDAPIVNSAGGVGVEVRENSVVRLLDGGQIVTGNTDGLGNLGAGGNGISTFVSGAPSNSEIHVDGLIQTQRALGIFSGAGDTIVIGATGRITTYNNGTPIQGSLFTTTASSDYHLDIHGTVEALGTSRGIFLTATRGTGETQETAAHADITIHEGGMLYAANNLAYTQDDGFNTWPEVIDNFVVAGTVARGTPGTVIDLNDGADRITFMPTYSLVGNVNGGSDAGGPSNPTETDTFALDGGDGTAATFDFDANQISNFEAGEKLGLGTWTLTGTTAGLTGLFSVNAGTLIVNGTLGNAGASVASGATLGGSGVLGGTVTIADDGTLSPGASIGALSVNGNLAFSAGSNFLVEVAPDAADRVNVTGTATLAGTLTAMGLGGTFAAGTQYTLLNALGGVTGTFDQLVTQGSFGGLAPTLSYDSANVILTLESSGPTNTATTTYTDALVFNAPTIDAQQIDLFETRIIGRLGGGSPLFDQAYNAAFGSPTVDAGVAAARLAITSTGAPGLIIVSDPVLTSRTVSTATSSSSIFTLAESNDTVTTVSTFGPATVTIGNAASCGTAIAALPGGTRPACGSPDGTEFTVDPGTVNINTITHTEYFIDEARIDTVTQITRETWELTGTVAEVGTIHAEVQSGLFDLGGGFLRRLSAPRRANSGWAEGYGFRVHQGGKRDALGFAGGVTLGLAPGVTLAFGLDHANLDLDVPGTLEAGDVGLTGGGAALRIESGGFGAVLAGSYAEGDAATLRTIVGSSAARYDVRVAGAALDIGYGFEAGGWALRPVAGLDYVSVHSDGFTESDTLGLIAAGQQAHRWRGTAGLEIGRQWGGFQLAASARYLTVLCGDQRTLPVAFALAPGRVLAMNAPSEPDAALIGVQAGIDLSPRTNLSFGYDGRFGGGYTAHSGLVRLTIGW